MKFCMQCCTDCYSWSTGKKSTQDFTAFNATKVKVTTTHYYTLDKSHIKPETSSLLTWCCLEWLILLTLNTAKQFHQQKIWLHTTHQSHWLRLTCRRIMLLTFFDFAGLPPFKLGRAAAGKLLMDLSRVSAFSLL